MYCFAQARRGSAAASRSIVFSALIRSDHCLRRSVLGEELSDPALCIEGQALCPGCRLAHNGSDALEISFRVFGAVFHHHFIVNMEDYLVPSRFQVVEGKFQAVPADGLCQVLGELASVGLAVLPACVGLFAVVDVSVIGDARVCVVELCRSAGSWSRRGRGRSCWPPCGEPHRGSPCTRVYS